MPLRAKDIATIVYVSTFPPRECGIATFTADLTAAMDDLLESVIDSRIVAMNRDDLSRHKYPRKVLYQIDQEDEAAYVATAEKINRLDGVKVVNVQHEFGIFGGPRGIHIVRFLETLRKPSIVTCHSVLPSPDAELHRTVCAIGRAATAFTVMTAHSKEILVRDYAIAADRIAVIPHGIHPVPYSSSAKHKAALDLSGKVMMLTFGFLSRGKGLEYVIEALPRVVREYPDVLYIILGVTHPNILKEEGESYRNSLIKKVHDLRLSKHVSFYNEYASLEELLQFLKAADIYISTSLDPNQAVSGTLSYALGCGRPVISTPFAQAREAITAESGILADFRSADSYAEAMLKLLKDPVRREQLGKNAYFRTRNMTWGNVALESLKLFSKYSSDVAIVSEQKRIPRVRLGHLFRLTDDFGMIQFAKLSVPDPSSGYTLDDNARALTAACQCYEEPEKIFRTSAPEKRRVELLKRIEIYLAFMEHVLHADGAFHNYVRQDRAVDLALNLSENLDDANGRALWALGVAASTVSLPAAVREKARSLLCRRIERYVPLESPRSAAFHVKGIAALLAKGERLDGTDLEKLLIVHCDRLVSLYRGSSSEEWHWFESYLTYSNAVFPEALLLGYGLTGNTDFRDTGLATLEFLIGQTFVKGIYVPIGQDGWHHKTGVRRFYDQQPEDVAAMTCALATAYRTTGEERYRRLMHESFNWFLGDNSLDQVVYDRTTGGCYDGIGEKHINLNQGAESTTSYLLARLALIGID